MRVIKKRFLLIIFYYTLIKVTSNLQIHENNLKDLLSESEWLTLMGNVNNDQYSLTYPRHYYAYHNDDKNNNNGSSSSSNITNNYVKKHHLILDVPYLNINLHIDLKPNINLLSSNFTYFETYKNGTNLIPLNDNDINCLFKTTTYALSICDGIRGILSHNGSYFTILPLPKRFHNDTHVPHIIKLRSKLNDDDDSNNEHCAHEYIDTYYDDIIIEKLPNKSLPMKIVKKRRAKRENFPLESPVFVETAVFVDRDLYDHMKINFPLDTERELIRFVLAMINAVQLLYHDPSLGRPVNFLLKRLEILKEEAHGLTRPPDIDRYLSSFCNWQRTKNPQGDREPQHWDHALILTGLDLYVRGKHGKISNQVVGLAPVAGMCTTTSSCTVNEGRHFESVYVVAHEIGHNLGMRHDGPLADNDCDPSSYIMSPTLGSGKITWSSCSRRYLQTFLDTPQSRCLLDHGSSAGQLDHSAEGALPGERFDANQQCMLKYGRGSRHSSQQPLDDVCRDLHCERERYTWTSHPALEGTMCGHNMWCRGGRCIMKGIHNANAAYTLTKSASIRIETVNGGWSSWKPYSDCASGCLFGEEGRLRSGSTGIMVSTRHCNNPRPQGNGRKCEGPEKKYQSCSAQQCIKVPKLTIREFADQICTRAREVDKDLTGNGIQKISSDPEEACMVWCQKRNGGTKSRGWTFPDGTICQTRRYTYGTRSSYCINGKCEEFVCDYYDESQFAQMPELCPIDREDNEITWRVGLRRRDNSRWISASGCHFNCITPGSGIRLVISKNNKNAKTSIQLCNTDKYSCGRLKTAFDYASMVCGKYKERVRRLSGLGMQISPAIEDPDRPCKVACQDENISHRFYLVNGEEGWFPFGTDCSRGLANKKGYCISGKCLEFGIDGMPSSQSEFTLPLKGRRMRRSLETNVTKIIARLRQKELDDIINKLNKTITGQHNYHTIDNHQFDIDLNNPIHVNMDYVDHGTITSNTYDDVRNEDILNYT